MSGSSSRGHAEGYMIKREDRNLGMDRPISRRDVLNGIGALAASTLLPGRALANKALALDQGDVPAAEGAAAYPPVLTGYRGNHVGSFEVAHQLAWDGRKDWGQVEEPDPDVYDLVVVGGGISGLAAAHFRLKEDPKARILILDNHDDFGGARQTQRVSGGRPLAHWLWGQPEPGRSFGVQPARGDSPERSRRRNEALR